MTVHDDKLSSERLLEIGHEVRRIASTLARLQHGESIGLAAPPDERQESDSVVPVEVVQSIIRARRMRDHYFKDAPFADPAWDMILDLFEAELTGRRVAVCSLCIGAAVPATTALRWINTLCEKGMLVRRNDPLDGRRVFVELSPQTSAVARRFFADAPRPPII